MPKTFSQILDWARTARPDLPLDPVLKYLAQHNHGEGTVYSPTAIARALRQDKEPVLASLILLADEPTNLLRPYWVFVDENDTQHEIDTDEVIEALRSGEFFHPTRGARVPNFRERIGMTYLSTRTGARVFARQGRR